jgi:hypothetical protein
MTNHPDLRRCAIHESGRAAAVADLSRLRNARGTRLAPIHKGSRLSDPFLLQTRELLALLQEPIHADRLAEASGPVDFVRVLGGRFAPGEICGYEFDSLDVVVHCHTRKRAMRHFSLPVPYQKSVREPMPIGIRANPFSVDEGGSDRRLNRIYATHP